MKTTRGLAAGIGILALAGVLRAQPGQLGAAGPDTKDIDQRVYKVLKDVINTGADRYNRPNNDHNGCYRLYQGSLMTLRPLLDHRPGLQKAIDEALAAAEREPSIQERAFIMRAAIDRVRDELGGKTTATAGKDKTTLWERLGGEKNVRKVVEDFMALEHADPKVDFFRGGKRKMTEEQLAELKQKLVEFISQAAGGPLKYAGKSMKEAHKGMAITEAQFDALVVDLKTALDKNGVKPADRDAVLEAVATMRRDIVEEKTGPKKDEEKKEPAKKEQEPKKGGGKPATAAAEIEGQITYDGKAVESGSIKLVPVKGEAAKPIESEIKNGGYHLTNVPPGEYTAVIASPPGKQKAKDAVPAQYGSEKTSPLRVSVNAGKNAFDIQLAK